MGILFACSEDKGNYDYDLVNDLKIKGIPTDTSVLVMERLLLSPKFERSQTMTEEGLEYSWTVAGKEISTSRDLDYTISPELKAGKNDCRLMVTDTQNGIKYYYLFNLHVVSPFSWGYYFLCEGENKATILSYFSAKEGTTDCIHVDMIGDYSLGSEPKTILEQFGNIPSLDDYYYTFYVVSAKGENPVISTNNGAFVPMGLVNNSSFVYEDTFNPTDAVITARGEVYFVSNGKVYYYSSNLLYRPGKHDKEYQWSHPAMYVGYMFAFDELSKKYYVLKNQINDPLNGLVADYNALDRVVEIHDQPSYEGQTFIYKTVTMEGDEFVLWLVTTENGKINLSSLMYLDYRQEQEGVAEINERGRFRSMESLALDGVDEHTQAILVNNNDWYFVIGNKIYTSPVLKPKLTEFTTLPSDLGAPTAIGLSSKGSKLIISTYNENSSHENKGSFVEVELTSKEVKTHRNVMGKCITVKGFDANPWW